MLRCEFHLCKLNHRWIITICSKYSADKVLISFLHFVERNLYYKEMKMCVKNNMTDMSMGTFVLIYDMDMDVFI